MAAPKRRAPRIISGVEWLAHKGSVGKIGETARLRIIGEDGNDVAPGETGEIYFLPNDGAGSTYHYLGAEPKRRADGWESLGDIGRLDAEGYLYLGDRLADMILRGGANIYPAEVEAAVTRIPRCAPASSSACPIRNSGSACTPSSNSTRAPMRKRSPTAWANSWPTGSAATSIRKVSRSVSVGLRDDSGKVRRTLLRDERAGWLKENRAFRIMPARARAKAD